PGSGDGRTTCARQRQTAFARIARFAAAGRAQPSRAAADSDARSEAERSHSAAPALSDPDAVGTAAHHNNTADGDCRRPGHSGDAATQGVCVSMAHVRGLRTNVRLDLDRIIARLITSPETIDALLNPCALY